MGECVGHVRLHEGCAECAVARLRAELALARRQRTRALQKAAQLVQDWPGIPDQRAVADAIRKLAEGGR